MATGWTTNMQELQTKMYRTGAAEVIELAGAVDALAFTHFAATLTRTMAEITPCIVLECSRVSYIGSAQLKELIGFAHMAQARGGNLKCVGLPQTIQQVANLIAMGDLMEFYDHLAEALQSFRTSPESVAH
jgi:anti-sigma B factor antagonist